MKFKVGEVVKCIEGYVGHVTEGKNYTVIGVGSEFLCTIRAVNDRGITENLRESRFVKINDKITKLMEEIL